MIYFAAALKMYREAVPISQSKLAKRANMNPATVHRYESQSRNPSFRSVLRLADALDLPANDRRTLLFSAGFTPITRDETLVLGTSDVELIANLTAYLQTPDVSEEEKQRLRRLVHIFVERF